ncbi:conserved hypothetical protein [gamma proteobacterium HTCC5015]|nr:conserved hypothetical protein [gamma proteobacterium HTCC5015]
MTFHRKALAMGVLAAVYTVPSMADHVTLNSADGYAYYFDPSEGDLNNINKGGLSDPISNVLLRVDGGSFNGSGSSSELNGRARFSGTSTISGLTVSRQTYVSSDENLFRQMNYLENTTGAAITVDVRIDGDYSGPSTTYVESSDGNATLDAADVSHIVDYNGGMQVVHVYGNAGAEESVDVVSGADGSAVFYYEWSDVTVEAGETVAIMTFLAGADDLSAAQERQAAFSGLAGDALQGIQSADLGNIVNWNFEDSDGDTIPDVVEDGLGLDKNDASDGNGDLDNDGLTNKEEYNGNTDLSNPDSDGDGLSDGQEVNELGTDPNSTDSDGDGLSDPQEVATVNYDPTDGSDGFIHVVTSGDTGENHQPQMAVDAEGRFHVVWLEYSEDSGEFEVRYKLLDANFDTLIDTVEVTSSCSDNQGHPTIAVSADGKAYLAWFDSGSNDGLIAAIDPSKHDLDGSSADMADIKAFTDAAADANGIISGLTDMKRAQVQIDSRGRMHIAHTNNSSEIGYRVFRADGSEARAVSTPFSIDGYDSYAYSQVRMVLDSDDNAHIGYSDGDTAYYAMYDGMAEEVLIDSTALQGASFGDKNMHVSTSVDGDGNVYVVWGHNDDDDSGSPNSAIVFASFSYASDDQDGDSADMDNIGYEYTELDIAALNPWYIHSAMNADGNIVVTYMTGGGNSMAPVNSVVVNTEGEIVVAETRFSGRGEGDYESYSNFAFTTDGYMTYATDTGSPKHIMIANADFVFEPVTTQDQLESSLDKALDFGGSSAFNLWGLAILLLPMGVRLMGRKLRK